MSNEKRPDFAKVVGERAAALHEHIVAQPAETLATFKSDPWALSRAIETYANENGVPMLFGPAKMAEARKALAAMETKPRVLVEFGAYVGYSALRWAAVFDELSSSAETKDIHIYTFELDPQISQVASDFVKLAGLEDKITVLTGPGDVSLKQLVADGKIAPQSVDVVFIDHWEQRYLPDLQLCEELGVLRVGSVVIADNTDFPGAPDYVKYVKNGGSGTAGSVKYSTKSYEADASLEPPRKAVPGFGPPAGQGGPGGPGGRGPPGNKPKIVEVSTVVSLSA